MPASIRLVGGVCSAAHGGRTLRLPECWYFYRAALIFLLSKRDAFIGRAHEHSHCTFPMDAMFVLTRLFGLSSRGQGHK